MSKSANSLQSPRFCGIRTFMRQPLHDEEKIANATLVGIPFDSGVSYRPGTRFGPAAIREASTLLKPYCPVLDVDISKWISVADYGDLDTIPGYMAESLDRMSEGLLPIIKSGTLPVIMGGDHSITLGILRAIHKVHGPVALLHFDAHSDTIPEYFGQPYNHGTPFYHAIKEGLILPHNSIQIGIRGPLYSRDALDWPKQQGLTILMGEEVHRLGIEKVIGMARERLGDKPVYVSFDIDFFDASCVPGTGTPEIEGFSTYEGLSLMRGICPHCETVGMDLVEVLPDKDLSGITALAGASVIHSFLASLALKKAQKRR